MTLVIVPADIIRSIPESSTRFKSELIGIGEFCQTTDDVVPRKSFPFSGFLGRCVPGSL